MHTASFAVRPSNWRRVGMQPSSKPGLDCPCHHRQNQRAQGRCVDGTTSRIKILLRRMTDLPGRQGPAPGVSRILCVVLVPASVN